MCQASPPRRWSRKGGRGRILSSSLEVENESVLYYHRILLMGILKELGRWWPLKDRKSLQETLLDKRLAETDRFLRKHEKEVNAICATPGERRLFRAAFAFATIPDIKYPFTKDSKDPSSWRTPQEQLTRIRNIICKTHRLNQGDQRVQNYLSTIEQLGIQTAIIAGENSSIHQHFEEAPTLITVARSMVNMEYTT